MRAEDRYDSLIRYYAEENFLDWLKVKAQIKAESNFDTYAVSRVGAKGLGQFMPATWEEWGFGIDPFNPERNIEAMTKYLRWLYARFPDKDDRKVFAAYNWGIGRVQKMIKNDPDGDLAFVGLPLETRKYLVRINKYYIEYMHEQLKKRPA